jgi:transcriptional regulator with XRE-family HTH domain
MDKSRQSEVIVAIDSPTISGVKVDGEKLRQLREAAFLSRAELGAGAGLHPDYIGKLERGDWQGGTRIDNIRKLAEVLRVDPHELVKSEE